MEDHITEELREIRHQLAAKFDNDVVRIIEDTRKRQAEDTKRNYVTRPRRPLTSIPVDRPPKEQEGE